MNSVTANISRIDSQVGGILSYQVGEKLYLKVSRELVLVSDAFGRSYIQFIIEDALYEEVD